MSKVELLPVISFPYFQGVIGLSTTINCSFKMCELSDEMPIMDFAHSSSFHIEHCLSQLNLFTHSIMSFKFAFVILEFLEISVSA